jgi:hypothetical protein
MAAALVITIVAALGEEAEDDMHIAKGIYIPPKQQQLLCLSTDSNALHHS